MPSGKMLYLLTFKGLAGASGLLQNDVSVQPLLPGEQLEPRRRVRKSMSGVGRRRDAIVDHWCPR
jgi:hypothetical protein